MQETQLPIDLLHWLLALLPIIALLVFLVVLRWKAPEAGPVGMFVAAAIAIFAYQAPLETLAVAGAKGVWDAIFILYVVWPALLLYRVGERAGGFAALRQEIERFSNNELFLVLAFGWVFASFLQGIAGFGTPIAVVAPLLVALGVRPVYAVAIPLIGHAWANMFGTLAVGWLATLQVVDLQSPTETAFQTAIMLWVPNLLAGFTIAWMYGRMKAVGHAWPMILIISAIHGGVQLGVTLWNPVLSAFLAATAGLVALYPLSLWSRYDQPADGIENRPAMEGSSEGAKSEELHEEAEETEPVMGLWMALFPYLVLTIATVVVLVIPAVQEALEQFEVGLPFPAVETGYGLQNEAEQPYSPFSPFTHPGTFLLIAALATWLVYQMRGYYDRWAEREETKPILPSVAGDAIPASVAVIAFLVMSTLMDHSGQTEVLALGIAAVAPPLVFAFASNWIGVLGAFMTSSNTASNILFAPLQQETAMALELSEATIIGAQSTGGAIGNAIAPANVVLGTGTAGIVGREGEVLRKTLPWAAFIAVVVGALTVLLNGISFTG
jgi:lactate permease